ncbi:MAG: tRNA threonylcarbamoyladenosine dehydratase [Verrucomicrobia bacterium]|jgi:tRNA A37 threonylcarbamoyladenosine dehydratase|nr:MAG: tRNA threonylcarbamoyladenosine dehydratase [Verrucomicrobiota bacterium]
MSMERFSGIARLYGESTLTHFAQAHVAVIGIGGVGSWVVEALARSGIGHVTMVDLDEICLTNINRQLHAMDGQIGRLKTSAMAERLRQINPAISVTEKQTFYSEKNAEEILAAGFDVVIDAIDAVRHKCHLIAACRERQIPVVTCGAAGGRRDPSKITVADLAHTHQDALLLQTRKNLRSRFHFPKATTGKKAKKFAVTAVFSTEPPVFPQCDGSVSSQRPQEQDMRLNCASGYGTATPVTATFGMIAAAQALEILMNSQSK